MQSPKDTVVVGLGNLLMSDEGVGVRIIMELEKRLGDNSSVDLIDAATRLASIPHLISGRRKAIFIDCAFLDGEPGEMRRFSREEVLSRKEMLRQSLHEGDLLGSLDLAAALGDCPEEIVIFGIQPDCVEFGDSLSSALAKKVPDYLDAILRELCIDQESD